MELNFKNTSKTLINVLLLVLIFGQRFVVTFGSFQFPIILFVVFVALFAFLLFNKITINRHALFMYLAYNTVILFSLATGKWMKSGSIYSLLYFSLLYLPFIFWVNHQCTREYVFGTFQKYMFAASIIGITQFIASSYLAINLNDYFEYIPSDYIQAGFKTYYEAKQGSGWIKSNGVFFLEPSFFSQFAALSLIIEYLFFKRLKNYLIYSVALIVSFSGTGILLLLVFAIINFHKLLRLKNILLFTSVLGLLYYFLPSYVNILLSRLDEFNSESASGFIRFVAPFVVLKEFLSGPSVLYGLGPGTVDRLNLPFEVAFSVIPKIYIEYGVIAGTIFMFFILTSVLVRQDFKKISIVVMFMYLFLAGNLLSPQIVLLFYILV